MPNARMGRATALVSAPSIATIQWTRAALVGCPFAGFQWAHRGPFWREMGGCVAASPGVDVSVLPPPKCRYTLPASPLWLSPATLEADLWSFGLQTVFAVASPLSRWGALMSQRAPQRNLAYS